MRCRWAEARRRRRAADAGAVTAELALTFPVVVLAIAVVLAAGSLARAQVSCVDAARSTARALARGDAPGVAIAQGQAVLGRPADIAVTSADGLDRVRVVMPVVVLGAPAGDTWRLPVGCDAAAWSESRG